jgi:hypothetical protein
MFEHIAQIFAACWRPVKYSAILRPSCVDTMPEVNTPVRILDFGTANGAVPSLRLEVDNVKPQSVLADHTVNPLITGRPDSFSGIGGRSSVAHFE